MAHGVWNRPVRRVDGRSHPPFRFRVSQWWKSLRRFPPYRAVFPRAAQRKTIRQLGARVPVRRPSGGVAQGDARQDAERGTMGQGRPSVTAPGAAPEGGKSGGAAARPGCRGALLFGYFLLGKQEKVTRRKGERGRFVLRIGLGNKLPTIPRFPISPRLRPAQQSW